MNLRRQLLLIGLLTLLLPWASCEFIRETESALRAGQQRMLASTARAHANSLAQYVEEYPQRLDSATATQQLFLHTLSAAPKIDGYFDDWQLSRDATRTLDGADGPVHLAIAGYGSMIYIFVEVRDRQIIYTTAHNLISDDGPRYADRVTLVSSNPPYLNERFVFAAEAPGPIQSFKQDQYGFNAETSIIAHWQDIPGGYRVEARIPAHHLGSHLGFIVSTTADMAMPPTRFASFSGDVPGPVVRRSSELMLIAASLVEMGTRALITDPAGWRIASVGSLSAATAGFSHQPGWSERVYDLLVEPGEASQSAEPAAGGRERQAYVNAALNGREMSAWFRSDAGGRAIVAAAVPIRNDGEIIGTLILQQGTDAILSLTNEGLVRLINLTLIVTVLVAGLLLGYATWLSRRIRRLSVATEAMLENETLQSSLPSALAKDEIGDLSRSFSSVLRQLDDYNGYLRSLASKLSHELRTPLAIVTSSLENLEHEMQSETSAEYTSRARVGAERLRRILSAMSEANRVEELMQNVDPVEFDLHTVLLSSTAAYRDVYPAHRFAYDCELTRAPSTGSPELLIQMLDKLIDNAVGFSAPGDTVHIALTGRKNTLTLSVMNPGAPLPENMRSQLFDSMVSIRGGDNTHHLGLGLYIAKLIAVGHGGSISADDVAGGVIFVVRLPRRDSR